MHGKLSPIVHTGQRLFESLKSPLNVMRYHSLCVLKKDLPDELVLDAFSRDDAVMAASCKNRPIYGLQFHPEALLTERGSYMLGNFIKICERYAKNKS